MHFVTSLLSGHTAWGQATNDALAQPGEKLDSMSRMAEVEGDEKALFQHGGRAVNRRVSFASAIRGRQPFVYLSTLSDGAWIPPYPFAFLQGTDFQPLAMGFPCQSAFPACSARRLRHGRGSL